MKPTLTTLSAVMAMTGLFALAAFGAGDGRATYEDSCKSFHGPDGSGNPTVAKMFKVEMRHLGSKEVQAKTDAEMKSIITKGVGKMPAVSGISASQTSDVVSLVRTLKKQGSAV